LLAKNTDYYTVNKKKYQKRNRSTRQIFCEEDLTVEEDLQFAQQLKSPDRAIQIDLYIQNKLSD